ncbi:hypothetical protein [Motilimonas pumila]|uniref:Uncharacterized protein n=1 Tax=Motilimonas pumila TaxID=2303987 RepID=A0A418YBA0_9GAMM|nr:hypothetical protein [Motilimonas pumila]RJG40262.1 hypothetical protein D1Z90_16590 [Motilimonas pumila]
MAFSNSNTHSQQSSILSEQELALLTADPKPKDLNFAVYSYCPDLALQHITSHDYYDLATLLPALATSPRGIAVILSDRVSQQPLTDDLLQLLQKRKDINLFWYGEMPDMNLDIPAFTYCQSLASLENQLQAWQTRRQQIYQQWLARYPVTLVDHHDVANKQQLLTQCGVQTLTLTRASLPESTTEGAQLIIINLDLPDLRLIDLLTALSHQDQRPLFLLYGQISENLSRAVYAMVESYSFPVLACLTSVPDKRQWQKLFITLFSRLYLKHWLGQHSKMEGAFPVHRLSDKAMQSYLCMPSMSIEEIAALPSHQALHKILFIDSLYDWFPEGIKRVHRQQLAQTLNCSPDHIDILFNDTSKARPGNILFALLVMTRLAGSKVYWLVEREQDLSVDLLKGLPVSDILLSSPLSQLLLSKPTEELLSFIELAKDLNIRLGATLSKNQSATYGLHMYGIEFILDDRHSIEQLKQPTHLSLVAHQ